MWIIYCILGLLLVGLFAKIGFIEIATAVYGCGIVFIGWLFRHPFAFFGVLLGLYFLASVFGKKK